VHFYLDGYNILFSQGGYKHSLETAREDLIGQISRFAACRKHPVTIVFDAGLQIDSLSRRQAGQLEVIYSPEGEDADTCLVDLLQHLPNPKRATLVSSDRLLKKKASETGARTMTTEKFLLLVASVESKSEIEPERKVLLGKNRYLFDYYLNEFEKRDLNQEENDQSFGTDWNGEKK
jgi:predicted RNA-binding protein with PIN domain